MNDSFKPKEKIKVNIEFSQIEPIELEEADSALVMEFDSSGNLKSQWESKHPSKIVVKSSKDWGFFDPSRIGSIPYKRED